MRDLEHTSCYDTKQFVHVLSFKRKLASGEVIPVEGGVVGGKEYC